jgi:glycine/D-amino acid oxidase-like deaminating enzyme
MAKKPHPWGTSPWTITFRPRRQSLPSHADFVVVGGGFAGLSAAAWLKRLAPNKSALLLEGDTLGNGASGRTGGISLAESAAGDLPGLGDVLRGYRRILRTLRIDAELSLLGAFELGRSGGFPNSPIHWSDSGDLRIVKKIPGGTVNPAKIVTGLARAAQSAGVQLIEHAEVTALKSAYRKRGLAQDAIELRVRLSRGKTLVTKTVRAERVLLATNAYSLNLAQLAPNAQPKLTLAVATEPLTPAQLKAIGLASRKPFYTVDLPYLWGRLLRSNAVIFGAGLVHAPAERNLGRIDVHKGEAAERIAWLEGRVRELHPALQDVLFTHAWGGPILFTEGAKPVFRRHPRLPQVTILAGFNGHGVALSVYLGQWAAQSLLGRRPLPGW